MAHKLPWIAGRFGCVRLINDPRLGDYFLCPMHKHVLADSATPSWASCLPLVELFVPSCWPSWFALENLSITRPAIGTEAGKLQVVTSILSRCWCHSGVASVSLWPPFQWPESGSLIRLIVANASAILWTAINGGSVNIHPNIPDRNPGVQMRFSRLFQSPLP